MEVAVSTLRSELAEWIERARSGEEIVVTDRGAPVARLLSVDTAPTLERLTQEGVLSKPRHPRRSSGALPPRVQPGGPVAELVGEQRR